MAQLDEDDITIVSQPSQPKLTISSARHCPKCGLEVADSTSVCPQDGTQIYEAQEEFLAAKYEFITVTGSGGMSVVYKARQRDNGAIVAIKMMHSLLMNDQALKRFQQEAKAITSLRHPNIINVHDFGVSEHGQPYMVMDFIDGNTLADVIKEKGGLTLDESLHRFIQLCDALEHAHEVGVFHRDLKPSNIMISNRDGNFADARIVDFGIAKLLDKEDIGNDAGHLTRTGELFGSPLYMSPEQCRGSAVDARTDIYSMGCVMYETLTGQPPLKGASMIETFVLQMSEVPISMSEACPQKQFPEELEAVIAKALAKDPDDRFQTMTDLEYALMQIQPNQLNQKRVRPKRISQPKVAPKEAMISVISVIAGFIIAAAVLVPTLLSHQPKAAVTGATKNGITVDETKSSIDAALEEKVDVEDLAKRNRTIRKHMEGGDAALIEALSGPDLGMTRIDISEADPPMHDQSTVLLGKLKSLKDLNLDDNLISDQTLQAIETLPLKKLFLRRTNIDDQGVQYHICHHMDKRLQELAITGCSLVGSDSIRTIGDHLQALKKLYITNVHFDDQSFANLKKLSSLQHLYAENTQVTDAGVSALSNLTELLGLHLSYTQTSDRAISHLTKLRKLEDLGLAHTLITDNATADLVKLQNLEKLDVGGTRITAKGLANLAVLKNLDSLYLYNTGMTDSGLACLVNFQNLDTLNLADTTITDAALDSISKMPNLKWLDLGGTRITDKGLRKLSSLKKLKTLILYECSISIAEARKLQKNLPRLHIRLLRPQQDEGDIYWKDPRIFQEYPDS